MKKSLARTTLHAQYGLIKIYTYIYIYNTYTCSTCILCYNINSIIRVCVCVSVGGRRGDVDGRASKENILYIFLLLLLYSIISITRRTVVVVGRYDV